MRREKAPCVELTTHKRITPVDRNRVRQHRLNDLFRGVARMRLVLEGDRELVVPQKGLLVAHAGTQRVEHFPTGIDRLVAGELPEKGISLPTQWIGDDERAKATLPRENGGGVMVGRLHERRRIDIERPVRHPEMTGMTGVFERKCPVARTPVGLDVLARIEDPHAVPAAIVTTPFADVREDHEIWIFADFETVAPADQSCEEVVVRIEAVPEARELQPDRREFRLRRSGSVNISLGDRHEEIPRVRSDPESPMHPIQAIPKSGVARGAMPPSATTSRCRSG